ncbi:MAG: hypothetical protein BWY69_00956 [Planctomycetes bacterium ADurb.Bin401]|nr:MAG: hypothetical protein BWY69_00956 [Planctomycetes bacterium ADurb.Bin401]
MKTNALLILILSVSAFAANYYVSPEGSDSNPGTLQKPFLTLEAARDAARNNDSGKTTIWLRGGTYYRAESFKLSTEDSGTKKSPVVYRSFKNEQVRITGGKNLDSKSFTVVNDNSVLEKLRPEAKGKLLQISLIETGINDFGKIVPIGFYQPILPTEPELFINDKPMTLARWPNSDWAKTGSIKADAPAPGPAVEDKNKNISGAEISFVEDEPLRWVNADDGWLFGYWNWDWCDSSMKIENIDVEKKCFKISQQPAFGVEAGRRYYAFNLLEEIDIPGEYYIDRKTGILYLLPPADFQTSKIVISLLSNPLVAMKDVQSVKFDGITFECTRGTAIQIINGNDNLISNCIIRNCGNAAVNVGVGVGSEVVGNYLAALYDNSTWNRNAGTNNGITGCEIYNMGEGGIILGGGDRITLIPGNNYAKDNRIHNFSRRTQTYRPAIAIDGVGNTASNNLIYDGPHNGIMFFGNEHSVMYNELYDLCKQTGDVGVIYTGRDYTGRGNKINYNYIHDTSGPAGKDSAIAIYLDDLASEIEVIGNVVYNVQTGLFIGGGRDIVLKDNIIAKTGKTIWFDERGLEEWFKHHTNMNDGIMIKRIKAVPYNQELWLSKYPKLAPMLDDNEIFAPKGNIVTNNIAINSTLPIEEEIVAKVKQYGRVQNNIDIKDFNISDCGKFKDYLRKNKQIKEVTGFDYKLFDILGPKN